MEECGEKESSATERSVDKPVTRHKKAKVREVTGKEREDKWSVNAPGSGSYV